MASQRICPSLPKLKVPLGHIPQRLKMIGFENPRARLEVLRQMVNKVVREDRCEFMHNRAVEARQYLERLIQLGVHRGPDDDYAKEMLKWWLAEQDQYEKMFEVLVPRFSDATEPYTSLYTLPTMRIPIRKVRHTTYWSRVAVGVLELHGHPFPSLEPLEERRKEMLAEHVKSSIKKDRCRREGMNSASFD